MTDINENMIRPAFTSTKLEEERTKNRPTPVKLNDADEEMLKVGMYMFNMHSKSGVLKILARDGLRVLLSQKTMEEWHYLTRGDRTRIVQNKPELRHFSEKGIPNSKE